MKIYVGKIPSGTTRRSLNRIFSVFGKVRGTKIIKSFFQGIAGAFGIVEMQNKIEAKQAIAGLDGSRLNGMTIKVNETITSNVCISGKKGHKKTVLIIDEESNLATGLMTVLKDAGCNTIATFMSSDLQEISETIKPDLVIVNLRRAREMGFSIIASMKKIFPSLPMVAISEQEEVFGNEELKEHGIDVFIAQPLDAEQLRSRIHILLEHKKTSVRSVEIIMPTTLGFHLRVVARFVKCVQQFHSVVRVQKGKIKADGKSIMGLLILAAAWKSKLYIEAEGDDAKQTIEGIKSFFRMEAGALVITESHADAELSPKSYYKNDLALVEMSSPIGKTYETRY